MINKRTLFIHFIVWLLFITYEISFVYAVSGYVSSFLDYFLHYAVNIGLFYINTWCLTYSVKSENKFVRYFFYTGLIIAFYMAMQYLTKEILISAGEPIPKTSTKQFVLIGGYRCFYILCLSFGYWFFVHSVQTNAKISKLRTRQLIQHKRKAELEKMLFKTRNAYLQSQINPHLLFNTLNFLYNSVYDVSKKSAEAIMLLSDMMRYSLAEVGGDGKVELVKEIENINSVIAINQLRFNQKLQVHMETTGNFEHKRIIPLILLTFVENIFKHGVIVNANFPAEIKINVKNNALYFSASNQVNQAGDNKQGFDIGINNARTRLNASYTHNHKLIVTQTDQQYTVDLYMEL